MPQKEVKVKVATETDLSKVESLEKRLKALEQEKLEAKLEMDTSNLDETNAKIQELQSFLGVVSSKEIPIDIDDETIRNARDELEALEAEKVDLEIKVAKGELDDAKSEVKSLDNTEINLQLAMQNFSQGIQTAKQEISELAGNMGDVLNSAGRMEQTESFLAMNLGADKAKQKLEEIRGVTDKLPGDDVTLQNLLSQAALKDADMTVDSFTQMGSAAADYMAAMQNFGKSSTETQQDLMNYILAGNTAEIERSPILQAHVDKLKEGSTVQERAKLLQEALTAEGWNGIAAQDIYNNKQQQFNDMLERGKTNMGGLFLEGAEGAMDYIIQLDDATGGLVGMGIAAADMAGGPLVDVTTGAAQIATGFKAVKDLNMLKWFKDLEIVQGLGGIFTTVKGAITGLIPTQIAEGAAGWFSIGWIALAIALGLALGAGLIYLYNNSEQFRQAVDALAGAIQYGLVMAWEGLLMLASDVMNAIGSLAAYIGISSNDIWGSIVNLIQFIGTLPIQLGIIFVNTIARLLGFKGNFVQTLQNTAINGVRNFINNIGGMYDKLKFELASMLSAVDAWARTLPGKFWDAGVNAVKQFLSSLGIASPGTMQRMLVWEISEMGRRVPLEGKSLTSNLETLGVDAVTSFGNPQLDYDFNTGKSANWSIPISNVDLNPKSNVNLDSTNLNTKLFENLEANINNKNSTNNNDGFAFRDLILNIGTVDNDDRIQEIIDAIKRELSFENTTAGRTV